MKRLTRVWLRPCLLVIWMGNAVTAHDLHDLISERERLLQRARTIAEDPTLRDKRNRAGDRPIHVAVRAGDVDIARILLSAGASISERDSLDYTPLQYASRFGPDEMVGILLKYSEKVDVEAVCIASTPGEGIEKTCLHLAAYRGSLRSVLALVRANAQIDGGQEPGKTPLSVALREGHLDVASALKKQGAMLSNIERFAFCEVNDARAFLNANPSIVVDLPKDVRGHTLSPLQMAALGGNLPVVRFLVEERKARVNRCGRIGGPLSFAADSGDAPTVNYLLDRGAEVNEVAAWGEKTPLIRAIEKNHDEVARLLASRGAHLDTRGLHRKETAIETARKYGGERLVKALREAAVTNQQPPPPPPQPPDSP